MCIPLREERLQIKILAYGCFRVSIFLGGRVMALRKRDGEQICQVNGLLADGMAENALDWEEYLA